MVPDKPTPPPLVTLRTLLILVSALCCGAVIGCLTLFCTLHPAAAVLAGLCAAGSAVAFLHRSLEH